MAIKAGATLSTHLGNGAPLMLPRHPNLLWEQLAQDDLYEQYRLFPSQQADLVMFQLTKRNILPKSLKTDKSFLRSNLMRQQF